MQKHRGRLLVDNLQVSGDPVAKGTQQAHVADVSAPGALTSSQAGALTSSQITGGESPTEAEHNALQTDVAALRAAYNQAQVDIAALRTTVAALVTAQNGDFAALEEFGIRASS